MQVETLWVHHLKPRSAAQADADWISGRFSLCLIVIKNKHIWNLPDYKNWKMYGFRVNTE